MFGGITNKKQKSNMRITVKVRTNKSHQKVAFNKELGLYEIDLKSNPVKGKANKELISLLKEHFKKKDIRIVSGKLSKTKIIEIN